MCAFQEVVESTARTVEIGKLVGAQVVGRIARKRVEVEKLLDEEQVIG